MAQKGKAGMSTHLLSTIREALITGDHHVCCFYPVITHAATFPSHFCYPDCQEANPPAAATTSSTSISLILWSGCRWRRCKVEHSEGERWGKPPCQGSCSQPCHTAGLMGGHGWEAAIASWADASSGTAGRVLVPLLLPVTGTVIASGAGALFGKPGRIDGVLYRCSQDVVCVC